MKNFYEGKSWHYLVSHPAMDTAVFDESVILLIEDTKESALGLIVNRPLDKTLAELDKHFEKYANLKDIEVFFGGPVASENLCFAIWLDDGSSRGDFKFGIDPDTAEKFLKNNKNGQAAAYLGYSGWVENQLKSEIDEGDWLTIPADISMLCEYDCEELWEELLFRINPIFEKLPEPPEVNSNLN